ncbi:uncharacterized protein LOC110361176 isoform X2 [Columba livia]|uniref:uncharacterized protein LOC110361176 isoform X2 n=1 Tax=Columba livia TaxID=8932 RepID=UPI0031BAE5E7
MELKIPGTGPSAAAAIAPNSGPVTIETHSRFRRKPEVGAVAAGTAGRPGGRSEGFGATGLRLGMSLGPWFGAVRAAFGASGLLPASSPLPPVPAPTQAMAAPADASLLSAELVADDGEEEALRRLLLQVTQDDEEPPPPTDPSRAVTPAARCPAPSQYVEVAEHLSQHPGVLLPQATPGVAAGRCRGTGLELRRCLRGAGWDPPHPPCWTAPAMVSSTLQHQLLHQLWYPLQPGDDHGQQGQARRAGHALAPVLHLQTTLCHHRCEILTQLDPLPAAHLSAHLLQGVVQLEHQQGFTTLAEKFIHRSSIDWQKCSITTSLTLRREKRGIL